MKDQEIETEKDLFTYNYSIHSLLQLQYIKYKYEFNCYIFHHI